VTVSKDSILSFHLQLLDHFGGIQGIRDENTLDYICNVSHQTINGLSVYPTITDQLAITSFLLISRHPFLDGNKRVGMHVLAVYLRYYGYPYHPSSEDIVDVALRVASHAMSCDDFRVWVRNQCRF
jgi:death on curing protein